MTAYQYSLSEDNNTQRLMDAGSLLCNMNNELQAYGLNDNHRSIPIEPSNSSTNHIIYFHDNHKISMTRYKDYLIKLLKNVPHIQQIHDWDCGLACLEMVLMGIHNSQTNNIYNWNSNLFSPKSPPSLHELINMSKTSDVWTIDLAYFLRKFNVEDFTYYTSYFGVNCNYRPTEFYKDTIDNERPRIHTLFCRAAEFGISIVPFKIILFNLKLKLILQSCVAILLVDLNHLHCSDCSPLKISKTWKAIKNVFYSCFNNNNNKKEESSLFNDLINNDINNDNDFDEMDKLISPTIDYNSNRNTIIVEDENDIDIDENENFYHLRDSSVSNNHKRNDTNESINSLYRLSVPKQNNKLNNKNIRSDLNDILESNHRFTDGNSSSFSTPRSSFSLTESITDSTQDLQSIMAKNAKKGTSIGMNAGISSPFLNSQQFNTNKDSISSLKKLDASYKDDMVINDNYDGHYILVVGYDPENDEFIYRDPGVYNSLCSCKASILERARSSRGTDYDCIIVHIT